MSHDTGEINKDYGPNKIKKEQMSLYNMGTSTFVFKNV